MLGRDRLHLFTAVSLFAGAGLFQFATPLAISAQSRASIQVGATVVQASGAWEADAMVTAVAAELGRGLAALPPGLPASARARDAGVPPAAASIWLELSHLGVADVATGLRREWHGTAVWVELPPRSGSSGTVTITVAHLAN